MTADLAFATIDEIARAIRAREVSPVELTQACLDRIRQIDPQIDAFITVTADLALSQAKTAQEELAKGVDRGPLQGVPIGLKDLCATKGIATTAHSKLLERSVPDEDATVTSRLYDAGVVLTGKLAMHEYAYGGASFDTPWPAARNPWNLDHVPGGSSSGSGAALAAGLVYGAVGSDTGGSIRHPASLCGIAGLKPTYGRVSRRGVVPLSWSLDHVGPMARSVADVAILLQAMAGHDAADAASARQAVPDYRANIAGGVKGLRIGVPRAWLDDGDGCDSEVRAAFDAALDVLRSEGAEVIDVDGAPFINARWPNSLILAAEAVAYHREALKTRAADYSSVLRHRLREGIFINAADYIDSQRARGVIAAQIGDIMKTCDLVLSPAMPQPAETFEDFDPSSRYAVPSFTTPYNLTGLPAMSIPCGFTTTGLPIGLQIAGRAFDEATVLRASYAYERATDWHQRHPSLT